MSVVASHLIWLLRTRGIRKRAKEAGKTFDDFPEAIEWQANGIDLEKMFLALFKKEALPDTTPKTTPGNTNTSTVAVAPSAIAEKQKGSTDSIV
jgi:hypothetical protein